MSQYDFGTIDPNTKSGTALATDLNSWRNALHSTHGGSSAPSYITAGMLWADTTSANYELKMYDGAQSITVAVIDATNNVARVAVDSAETSYITSTTAGQIQHIISGSAMVTVNSTGVGIGTSSPSAKLDVQTSGGKFLVEAFGGSSTQIGTANGSGSVFRINGDARLDFYVDKIERARIDASGNVLVGTATPFGKLTLAMDTTTLIFGNLETDVAQVGTGSTADSIAFGRFSDLGATFTEYARFDSGGGFLVGATSLSTASSTDTGFSASSGGFGAFQRASNTVLSLMRQTNDGTIVDLRQGGTSEGTISVSGTTVSYNGGHLSRWAQFPDNSRPELLKGTVMSNLDQMSNWDNEDNEQLNCVQVSAVESDANVAGVFVAWDSTDDGYNDILLAMTGDMVIRIAGGTTVQRGDLLMSAGDGTAKPQGDDIVRSKTIAKVTSTHISHTYADGSYAVPCVLMAC